MKFSSSFDIIVMIVAVISLLACNPRMHRYSTEAMSVELSPPKRSRSSLTYPPYDLSKPLIDFRRQIGRWPNSWLELQLQNPQADGVIDSMLGTNFNKLEIQYASKDSLSVYYEYSTVSKRYQSKDFVLAKLFKGLYIFGLHNGNIDIENRRFRKRSDR